MSTPQEIQNDPGANGPADESMNLATAVRQLRMLVCGLGVGLLIVSLTLTAFVYKQNRNLLGTITLRQRQISQLQASGASMGYLLNELAKYSNGRPELMALFAKHGMEVHGAAPATPSQPSPQR